MGTNRMGGGEERGKVCVVPFDCGIPCLKLLLALLSGFGFVEGTEEHREFVGFLDLRKLTEEDGCSDDLALGPVRGRFEEKVATTGKELLLAVSFS